MVELLAREPVSHAVAPPADVLGNLALHHLFAACRFSANVAQVEHDNAGRPLGSFWEEILHNSLGVAALTVTLLDGYAQDLRLEGSALAPRRHPAKVAEGAETDFGEGILGKYSAALAARTGKTLDYSIAVVRNADTLIKLRNEVVRMRAVWPPQAGQYERLAEQLQTCFSPSVFFPGEAVLPRAWASYSFASWALRTTVEFLEYVYAEAGVPSPVAGFRKQLTELCGAALKIDTAGRQDA
ncbi:MAG: hypothetical protein HGA75_07935 [Thiobacillus sp.]|nr:hypothetical protein [Thiobacillus sp.]